ncbi:MAG: hypothetical protein KME10_23400 [Plectolyngbya sp. WJT66-NPBG17]|nr:hypothetical protein [Plectolyngbya sp. WJT66-NPBG17]
MAHFAPGILGWVVGVHSAVTFRPLWDAISVWQCYFWVTTGCGFGANLMRNFQR